MEYKVDEEFWCDEVNLQLKVVEKEGCSGCIFNEAPSVDCGDDDIMGACSAGGRSDKRNVIFKDIELDKVLAEEYDSELYDKLFITMSDYMLLMFEELKELMPIAQAQGWKSTRAEQAIALKEEIRKIKEELDGSRTED